MLKHAPHNRVILNWSRQRTKTGSRACDSTNDRRISQVRTRDCTRDYALSPSYKWIHVSGTLTMPFV